MSSPSDLSWHLGHGPVAERKQMQQTYDQLGAARCPLCRAALIARQGRDGPYFHCLCVEPKASQPPAVRLIPRAAGRPGLAAA